MTYKKHFYSGKMLVFCMVLAFASVNVLRAEQLSGKIKPFRVLLIIGDQWDDPAGYMVEIPEPTGEYSGYDSTPEVDGDRDFHHLVVLLKSWGIPFDIVRLDQQLLDRYMFLDMYNKLKYGTIIWDVNQSDKILNQDYSIVSDIIKEFGIGMIGISDRITQPEIQSVLGIKYTGSWESNVQLTVKTDHFITQGLPSPFMVDRGIDAHIQRPQVEIIDGTKTVVEQGTFPQVTIRENPSGSHMVWIGNDHNYLFYFRDMRTLLRRAITWTIGYNIFKTWDNDLIMIMDDPGGASNTWLEHWHYPVLSEEIIERYLIGPLLKHSAVLNINFVPAFVNEGKMRLEPAWTQSYTDKFGTKQDYTSSKKGYNKGVKLGVFEVLCHGLTHMQPDLVSDPGWYGASIDKEKSEVGWYREFGDVRRKKEIPPAEQLWRMKTAGVWLTEQFGVVPLQFCPGGLGTSISYFSNTAKLAGQAGYGWYGWEYGYLGKDMAVTGWKFFGTSESPLIIGALPDAHDFGISREPEEFAKIFDMYPKGRFISINEYIGYLHANNSGNWDNKTGKLSISIGYDQHYCKYFETHDSYWNLEIADWLEKEPGRLPAVSVDGNPVKILAGKIMIKKGLGEHRIDLAF